MAGAEIGSQEHGLPKPSHVPSGESTEAGVSKIELGRTRWQLWTHGARHLTAGSPHDRSLTYTFFSWV